MILGFDREVWGGFYDRMKEKEKMQNLEQKAIEDADIIQLDFVSPGDVTVFAAVIKKEEATHLTQQNIVYGMAWREDSCRRSILIIRVELVGVMPDALHQPMKDRLPERDILNRGLPRT